VPGPFGTNPVGAYTEIDTVSRGENVQTVASISAVVPLGARARSFFQTGYHRLESDFVSPFGPSESSSRRWSGRAQIDFPVFRALEISAGAELQREQAGSTFVTDEFFEPKPVKRTVAGYFAEARWSAASRVFVTAGVRLEDIHRDAFALLAEDDVLSVNPKAGVAWILNPGERNLTRLRASAGTGIRPPGAFDIAFTDNPSLKPERSRSAEAGIEQVFAGGRAAAEAVGFWNEYDDLIVAVGSFRESSRYMTDNISNARSRGVELGLTASRRVEARVPVLFRARIGYTLVDSEILAVDRERQAPPPFTVGDPLLRRPRHQVSIDGSATAGPLSVFLTGGARSRVLDVEPSLGTFGGLHEADGFNVWNLGGAWRIRRLGEVYARVENLFDEHYEEALGFPALGRRATIGLRVAAGR
jgi:outer membrane receptor protein involved in Fe transport